MADAESEVTLESFMVPFRQAGSVEMISASTCVSVVASGGCAAPLPAEGETPSLNAETACQDAIDAGLVVHRAHPLNAETSIPALMGGVIMPNARFYVRNHFAIPNLGAKDYRLSTVWLSAS